MICQPQQKAVPNNNNVWNANSLYQRVKDLFHFTIKKAHISKAIYGASLKSRLIIFFFSLRPGTSKVIKG